MVEFAKKWWWAIALVIVIGWWLMRRAKVKGKAAAPTSAPDQGPIQPSQ